jgi:3-phenylpropionate/trans-cinnamate dioxygenase ferredoxin reductase subunit
MPDHLVIVGGGQASAQAAQTARQCGFAGRISLIGEEACLPYQRPPLSKKFLAGEMPRERLALKPSEFYRAREIDLRPGSRVTAIDPGAGTLTLDDAGDVGYSHLILATGSLPRRLSVPGVDLPGIHYLRSLADAESIQRGFAAGERLVVIGAGFIGLEVAAVAVAAGLGVVVLEAGDRVMARSVGREVSDFCASRHRLAGVDLRLGAGVVEFWGDARVRGLTTATGERIGCDLVIIGIGVVPRTELAQAAGLAIDNGIRVDAHGRASAPNVFAAGDCTSHPHPWAGRRIRLESVQNAIEQAKAAAATAAGQDLAFDAVPWFWSDQYDLKLQIAGLSEGYASTVVRGDPDGGSFSVYYLDREGRAIAVDAVNDPRGFVAARQFLAVKPRWPAEAIADPDCDLGELVDRAPPES